MATVKNGKQCRRCLNYKKFSEFGLAYGTAKVWDGHDSYCKVCRREYMNCWRKTTRKAVK